MRKQNKGEYNNWHTPTCEAHIIIKILWLEQRSHQSVSPTANLLVSNLSQSSSALVKGSLSSSGAVSISAVRQETTDCYDSCNNVTRGEVLQRMCRHA